MQKIFILVTSALLVSCSGTEDKKVEQTENVVNDSVVEIEVTENAPDTNAVIETPATTPEASSIESFEKTSSGPSFCECVKKNQALENELMTTEDDAMVDEIMKKMEKLRDGECQILKAGPQMTSAQKKERERKVKECLAK